VSKLLIPNVTPVPNALFDHVFLNLRPGALRVLLAIVRLTYGWQKVSDRISYSQLQKVTGLSREGVNNAVKELGNLLTVKPGAKGRGANEYSLNVDISTGELVRKVDQSEKLTSQNRAEKVVRKVDSPRERIPKKKNPDFFFPIIENIIGRINELSSKAYRADTKAVCKYLRSRLKAGKTESDCLAVVEDRWARWVDSEKMREHFNPVTLFREENFARYLAGAQARHNGANGHAKPAEVKDLGDGFVEVDGRRMDKRLYERRFADAAN
jgi:phage replication O-like protein O